MSQFRPLLMVAMLNACNPNSDQAEAVTGTEAKAAPKIESEPSVASSVRESPPPREPTGKMAVVGIEKAHLRGAGSFLEQPRPCFTQPRKPKRLCAMFVEDVDPKDDALFARLKPVAKQSWIDESDIHRLIFETASLEQTTEGIVRFEVERATAGADDCLWRLRKRVGDQILTELLPVSACPSPLRHKRHK